MHTCGVVEKLQSYSGLSYIEVASPGVITLGSSKRFSPASITRTEILGSSVRLFANTSPAVPPPTIIKSYVSLVAGKFMTESTGDCK